VTIKRKQKYNTWVEDIKFAAVPCSFNSYTQIEGKEKVGSEATIFFGISPVPGALSTAFIMTKILVGYSYLFLQKGKLRPVYYLSMPT
jgi:hypothetical protein